MSTSLRILQVHSEYARRGGEEAAVEMDAAILRAHGHDVFPMVRRARDSNAWEIAGEILGIRTSLSQPFHPGRLLKLALAKWEPDVVHLHNWQRWGPRGLDALGEGGVPVVATAHNFRTWCPAGTAHKDGMPCNACMHKRFPWPAAKFGCWHGHLGSTVAAIGAAQMDWSVVDHWIAVSSFVRDALIEARIAPPGRITVRHGSVADSGPPGEGEGGFALAVCPRDRPEKGLALLMDAWTIKPRPAGLIVIGAANLAADWAIPDNVVGVSAIPRNDLLSLMGRAAFVIVPSIWHDPCPTVAIEALSRGTPVLATRMGGLPELIDERCGWTVGPTSEQLSAGIRQAFAEAAGKRAGARTAYLERFTADVSYRKLMLAYGGAQAHTMVARGAAQPMGVQL